MPSLFIKYNLYISKFDYDIESNRGNIQFYLCLSQKSSFPFPYLVLGYIPIYNFRKFIKLGKKYTENI